MGMLWGKGSLSVSLLKGKPPCSHLVLWRRTLPTEPGHGTCSDPGLGAFLFLLSAVAEASVTGRMLAQLEFVGPGHETQNTKSGGRSPSMTCNLGPSPISYSHLRTSRPPPNPPCRADWTLDKSLTPLQTLLQDCWLVATKSISQTKELLKYW